MEFKKLQIARKPLQKTEVNITEFWKNFKSPTVLKENGQISNLHFSPSNNGQLAVTAGCKVSIYNTSTNSLVKSISRFQDLAYSGTIRDDGKLMVAGDASGIVQIFDLSSRSILRTFKGHNGSVPCTKFMPNVQQILTASYDKTVKIWDVPSQSPIISFEGHEDYIKTAVVNPSNHSQIISGSYDHCVKLWDVRSGQCTSTINHQAPIESIEVFGNGGMIAVGGGPSIQVYDLISGKSLITLDNFQKTVTSVKLTKDGGFLMGGSLDRYVKCYDTSDWSLCNSVKFPGMVSAIDISNDNTHMVVGMTTGIFSIQTNKVQKSQNAPLLPKSEREFGNERLKRKYEDIPSTENVVVVEKEARAAKYYQFDHLLRKFKYKEALDAALRTHDPALGFGLISELIRRGGLISALSGRDDVSLQPIIAYLARNLRNHTDKSLIIDVTQLVMELYGDVVWKSKHLDAQLRRLMTSIYNEKKLVQNLIQFQGRLGMVLSKVNGNGSN